MKVSKEQAKTISYGNHYSWDSLTHVLLVSSLESEFGVHFSSEDILNMKNYECILKILTDMET
jgi:acyl carrier protein